ncbi:unnamed protein product, partial [Mesorhabditis belari]|uniref:F-box domain-containing protein n=1 Tax=Mesorhabditis belari TaxID=2138241 RepID=A0AAF3EHB0_9BILA
MNLSALNFDVLYSISQHLDAFSICNLASTSSHFHNILTKSRYLQKASQSKLHLTFRSQHVTVCLDKHCFCFCIPKNYVELTEKDWTYCCSLHIDSEDRKILPSNDYIYSALKFITKLLRTPCFQVVEVEIIEHPWFITTEFEERFFQENSNMNSISLLLNELSNSISQPILAKSDPTCEEMFGAANNFRGYFRAIHRRLLQSFGFQNAIWIVNELLREGWTYNEMNDSILCVLSGARINRYREFETRLLLPEYLRRIFSTSRCE